MSIEPLETNVALAEYQEIAEQFRALTNIRFKLLTYLPAGTATLAALISKDTLPSIQSSIAAFGFIVTICLGTYNSRNDQHYDELVARAAQIEREYLKLPHGFFANRPQGWLRFGKRRRWVLRKRDAGYWIESRPVPVEHRWPIGLIYASTCALWASLFMHATFCSLASSVEMAEAEAAASLLVFWAWIRLREAERSRRKRLKAKVVELMREIGDWQAAGRKSLFEKLARAIALEYDLFGIEVETAKARTNYFAEQSVNLNLADLRDRSLVLASVIDLPARWIEDVSTGRR